MTAPDVEPAPWRGRWVLYALGALAVAYGARGLLMHAADTVPPRAALWLVAGVIVHDALVVPAVLLVGAAVVRLVPAVARPVVQGALFVSGVLALVAVPLLLGRGGAGNPTSGPLPYERNLVLVLVAVWLLAGLLVGVRLLRSRTGRSATRASS